MKSDVNKLLKKNAQLNHLDAVEVISHVQRESGEWVINTLMLEGYDVPFLLRPGRELLLSFTA